MRININTKCIGTTTTSNVHAILGTNFWVQRAPKCRYIKHRCTQNINVVGSMCYHFVCIVSHGLYDETLEISVPYFDDVVENGSKSRISNFFRPLKEVPF
ncbi:hypothetical protein PFMALIP_05807 [Plasmodium falciparum MaliPS096_E11]|uniref:Uncharacterized protein n=1 Tax=Plasmodium falciparum MaliPS096_E11 TaxID=1036727 RepID=A0A024WG42_PLAFA|nr:hypothetical protein PFMALIP_05807 [Plasmodium falciparum MaliPS096_E11]